MLSALIWYFKTKLNQIQCEYNDQLQKGQKLNKILQEVCRETITKQETMLRLSAWGRKGKTPREVAKTIREKGTIKGKKTK